MNHRRSTEPTSVLVLDLDETLVHTVSFAEGQLGPAMVAAAHYRLDENTIGFTRPGLKQFLDFVQQNFTHVGVWTAAESNYATFIVLNILHPLGFRPKFLLTGQHCEWRHDSQRQVFVRIKPLQRIWKNPDLQWLGANETNTLVIDDRPETAMDNPRNLIQIPEFNLKQLLSDTQLNNIRNQLANWLTMRCHPHRPQISAVIRPTFPY